jgi:hypothetical protein
VFRETTNASRAKCVDLKNVRVDTQMSSQKAGPVTHRVYDGASGAPVSWSNKTTSLVDAYSAKVKTNS